MAEKISWHSVGDELVKCPVPGCGHIGIIITKVHCRMTHDMTRDEVGKQYGVPTRIITLKQNQTMRGVRSG